VSAAQDGERRLAQQKGGVVRCLYGDHLGSVSVETDASGARLTGSDTRYRPNGETRLDSGGLPTDRRLTGEREEKALGIYSLGARFYDPYLDLWIQVDNHEPSSIRCIPVATGSCKRA
jgi:RHS repeat-associated protein